MIVRFRFVPGDTTDFHSPTLLLIWLSDLLKSPTGATDASILRRPGLALGLRKLRLSEILWLLLLWYSSSLDLLLLLCLGLLLPLLRRLDDS